METSLILLTRPVTSISPDWYFFGVSSKWAPTTFDERNWAGSSTIATKGKGPTENKAGTGLTNGNRIGDVCDGLGAYPGLMGQDQSVKQRFEALSPFLDERQRRLMVGTEAAAIGYGGISAVSRATGISRDTIRRGLVELNAKADEDPARVRQPGGGRKQAKNEQPGLLDALRELVEPITRGDPGSLLRWVSKGVRKLSAALRERGFIRLRKNPRTIAIC
jgi:hypothetical protein